MKTKPATNESLFVCGRVDSRTGHECELKHRHKGQHKCGGLRFRDADCENQVVNVPQLAKEVWALRRLVEQLERRIISRGGS